jgi:glycosyltransferase involved in cell wall biosynthesis
MRFAVLSHILPPSATGQPVMLGRLLSGVAPDRYVLIGLAGFHCPEVGVTTTRALPAPRRLLPREWRLRGAGRLGVPQWDWRFRLRQRARRLARLIEQERPDTLVACSGELMNIPAAVLAAERTGVRLVAYYFDDYPFQWLTDAERNFGASWEKRLIAAGGTIVVPNELLRDEVERRGSTRTALVRNPLPDDPGSDPPLTWPASSTGFTIAFAGAIYHAHADAFTNLLAAMERASSLDTRLRILTAQPEADLAALGLLGGRVERHGHVPEAQVLRALREADLLFLPLAFHSAIPEVIRTSSPGKLAEYLASGRPVLVHAPADSFPAWYARRNACAFVADRLEPEALAGVLREIAADPARTREVASRALTCARRDFAPDQSRRALLAALNGS